MEDQRLTVWADDGGDDDEAAISGMLREILHFFFFVLLLDFGGDFSLFVFLCLNSYAL